MEWASNFIKEIYTYLKHRDDTSIDRLNRLYTVALLSTFVTVITTQQYVVGGKIVCWTPQEFSSAHNSYAQDICWLGHTNYYVPENSTTLMHPSIPRSYPFSIYPWLPIILIGMTVSFAAPYLLIWRGLSTRFGMDINRLIKLQKQEELTQIIHYILLKKSSITHSGRFYVTSVYLLTKMVYVINLIGQLLLTNKLLTGNYLEINIKYVLEIFSVRYNMWSSAHFPIETMCDFMIRMLGQNNNWYTIQCILPFNLFTKRIFAFLTIWFMILLVLNLIDLLVVWFWQRIWLSSRRYDYVFRLFHVYELYLHKKNNQQENILATRNQTYRREFVYKYLGMDGYLLLKLLHANSTDLNMTYLVANLFKQFSKIKSKTNKSSDL